MARKTQKPAITLATAAAVTAAVRKAAGDILLENTAHGAKPAKGKPAADSATKGATLHLNAAERAVAETARAGMVADTATMANDVAALQAAAKDGKACKTYAALFKAGVIAAILNLPEGDEGLCLAIATMSKGAKRTPHAQAAILAAANRLSRRVKAAGLEAANPSGKKRGAKGKPTAGKPAAAAPAAAPAAPIKADAPPVMAPRTVRAPIIVSEHEWAAHISDLAAYLRTCQKKNAKPATARVRRCITAILNAEAALAAAIAADAAK